MSSTNAIVNDAEVQHRNDLCGTINRSACRYQPAGHSELVRRVSLAFKSVALAVILPKCDSFALLVRF